MLKNAAFVFSGSFKYSLARIGPSIANSPEAPIGDSLFGFLGSTIHRRQDEYAGPIFKGSRFLDTSTLAVQVTVVSVGPAFVNPLSRKNF